MGFYASNFVYNNIISSEYGLRISSLNDSGSDHSAATVELFTQNIYRRPKVYLLGVQQTPVLTIPISVTTPTELSSTESSTISRWLFGQMNYKKLQILQPDMQYIYFNCIFTEPQILRIGNIIRGYTATIVCDSPFAWEYPYWSTHEYSEEWFEISDSISINNSSDNPDYTYPTVQFKINQFGGGISIINNTDNGREFVFENLSPNEIIRVDSEVQSITSSTGLNRFTNFTGYKWFRYVPNKNNLSISGNVGYVSFLHHFAKKVA